MSLRAFFLTAIVAGVVAGVAGADTTVGFVTGGQQTLPSAGQPNGSGSIVVPFDLSSAPPVPERRTYAQLVQLVLAEHVDFETAAAAATNRHDFEISVQQALRRKQAAEAGAAAAAEVQDAAGETEAESLDDDAFGLRIAST